LVAEALVTADSKAKCRARRVAWRRERRRNAGRMNSKRVKADEGARGRRRRLIGPFVTIGYGGTLRASGLELDAGTLANHAEGRCALRLTPRRAVKRMGCYGLTSRPRRTHNEDARAFVCPCCCLCHAGDDPRGGRARLWRNGLRRRGGRHSGPKFSGLDRGGDRHPRGRDAGVRRERFAGIRAAASEAPRWPDRLLRTPRRSMLSSTDSHTALHRDIASRLSTTFCRRTTSSRRTTVGTSSKAWRTQLPDSRRGDCARGGVGIGPGGAGVCAATSRCR